MHEISPSASYSRQIKINKNSVNPFPLIDASVGKNFRQSFQGIRGLQAFHFHYRLLYLNVYFYHDGLSLPRATLPEVDDLAPAYEQEAIINSWLAATQKRTGALVMNDAILTEPFDFVYTNRGLVQGIDFLGLLGIDNLIIDESLSLSFYGGLKGEEYAIVYVAWNEYLTGIFK